MTERPSRGSGLSLPVGACGHAEAPARSGSADELFDVLVIGGGVTGCGVALDAASRGLSVALVEKRDFAAGTSSRSSKLIHGGLRYLERFDLGLVREALHERRLLVETSRPTSSTPRPSCCRSSTASGTAPTWAPACCCTTPSPACRPAMPRHRHLSHAACLRAVPSLRDDALTGGIRYYDAQVDDARFAVTLAGTAFAHGACCVSAVEVVGVPATTAPPSPESRARDLERGDEFDVRARVTINATGVWTTEMERLAGVDDPAAGAAVEGRAHRRPARPHRLAARAHPAHREERPLRAALGRRTGSSGPPTRRGSSAWTTRPPRRADIDYLLGHANAILREPLTAEDITGRLRRAAAAGGRGVRRHGGRLARARGAPQRAGAREHRRRQVHDLPHHGARRRGRGRARPALRGRRRAARRTCRCSAPSGRRRPVTGRASTPARRGLSPQQVDHLARPVRHAGAQGPRPRRRGPDLASAAGRRGHVPGRRGPVRGAQRGGAARGRRAHAPHAHRLRDAGPRPAAPSSDVARLMAPVLEWDEATVSHEIEHYRARLDAESAAQTMLDDAAADAARAPVRDVRLERRARRGARRRARRPAARARSCPRAASPGTPSAPRRCARAGRWPRPAAAARLARAAPTSAGNTGSSHAVQPSSVRSRR